MCCWKLITSAANTQLAAAISFFVYLATKLSFTKLKFCLNFVFDNRYLDLIANSFLTPLQRGSKTDLIVFVSQ